MTRTTSATISPPLLAACAALAVSSRAEPDASAPLLTRPVIWAMEAAVSCRLAAACSVRDDRSVLPPGHLGAGRQDALGGLAHPPDQLAQGVLHAAQFRHQAARLAAWLEVGREVAGSDAAQRGAGVARIAAQLAPAAALRHPQEQERHHRGEHCQRDRERLAAVRRLQGKGMRLGGLCAGLVAALHQLDAQCAPCGRLNLLLAREQPGEATFRAQQSEQCAAQGCEEECGRNNRREQESGGELHELFSAAGRVP